jgi:hypothetical protein
MKQVLDQKTGKNKPGSNRGGEGTCDNTLSTLSQQRRYAVRVPMHLCNERDGNWLRQLVMTDSAGGK